MSVICIMYKIIIIRSVFSSVKYVVGFIKSIAKYLYSFLFIYIIMSLIKISFNDTLF